MSFDSILIANRGEIACRILRTASAQGFRVIAIYSDADREAAHVAMADEAMHVGAAPATESYLNSARVIEAARHAGAGAIHPGYGFLAENAAFAAACEQAGIVFIGPSSDAIALMGNKAAAKRRMIDAGVACLPGYHGDDQSDDALIAAADSIGYPVMVKASAGGGGRGMRLVMTPAELPAALAVARTESSGSFGSDELILERALLRPRHVEIQVLADRHGHAIHLGERDCSVQRRHQKVIEEAPCPVMTAPLRERMGAAAVEAAMSIGYYGAGTVEFLLSEDNEFFFMEMNTRLQVEHPVTEMITGIDLVQQQIRVAEGRPLDITQDDVSLTGHAIEARLYAEDPAAGFLPDTGRVDWLHFGSGAGIRVDAGVTAGAEISPYYDAMVAKIIALGCDRQQALCRLRKALVDSAFLGPASNRDFLIDALAQDSFAAGRATTAFVDEHYPQGVFERQAGSAMAAVAALLQHLNLGDLAMAASVAREPDLRDFSSAGSLSSHYRYASGDDTAHVIVRCRAADQYQIHVGDAAVQIDVLERDAHSALLRIDGVSRRVAYATPDERRIHIASGATTASFSNSLGLAHSTTAAAESGQLRAPMHGVLVELRVASGDRVARGDHLCILEAMKMQHELLADRDGVIHAVHFEAGAQVPANALILEIGFADAAADEQSAVRLTQAADFCDESDALYELLAPLADPDYERATQFKGWTANDILTHLHVWNKAALLSLTDEDALLTFLGKVRTALITGDLRRFESEWLGDIKGVELRENWHEFYLAMTKRFASVDPKTRVKWAGPDMSVRSSITARLMETWAHGQALYDLLGVQRTDTDRIRNIATLGVNTFGWTFKNRRLEAPGVAPRVTLTAPSGEIWEWNADNRDEQISGSASEFCQVVTQVRNIADTKLQVEGETAVAWMAIAQCFAGPPHAPPAAGSRFRAQD